MHWRTNRPENPSPQPASAHHTAGLLVVVIIAFAVSRLGYYFAGVRFGTKPLTAYWQFIDPELLRNDLLRSVFHLHSQPPLFNLFLGATLKLFPNHWTAAFAGVYLAFGAVLALSLYLLMIRLGVSPWLSAGLTLVFMLSPTCVLYENWLFYTYPLAMLLCLAAVFLHRFLASGRVRDGMVFFALLAVIGLTRSMFHVLWFVAMVFLLLLHSRQRWRRIALVSSIPLLVVLLLYAKNLCLFGSFTSSSWIGMNFSRITTFQLPREDRRQLFREGTVSSFVLVHPFTGDPRLYESYYANCPTTNIPVLDEVLKTTGRVNYHNLAFVDVSKQYLADALLVLTSYPRTYLSAVGEGCATYLRPASDYRPLRENRAQIGRLDRVVNLVLYGHLLTRGSSPPAVKKGIAPPKREPGQPALWLVVGYPFLVVWGLVFARSRIGAGAANRAVAVTVVFILITVLYVTVVGNAVELGENNRFRFMVDPLMLVLLGLCLNQGLRRLRGVSLRWGAGGRLGRVSAHGADSDGAED